MGEPGVLASRSLPVKPGHPCEMAAPYWFLKRQVSDLFSDSCASNHVPYARQKANHYMPIILLLFQSFWHRIHLCIPGHEMTKIREDKPRNP